MRENDGVSIRDQVLCVSVSRRRSIRQRIWSIWFSFRHTHRVILSHGPLSHPLVSR